ERGRDLQACDADHACENAQHKRRPITITRRNLRGPSRESQVDSEHRRRAKNNSRPGPQTPRTTPGEAVTSLILGHHRTQFFGKPSRADPSAGCQRAILWIFAASSVSLAVIARAL